MECGLTSAGGLEPRPMDWLTERATRLRLPIDLRHYRVKAEVVVDKVRYAECAFCAIADRRDSDVREVYRDEHLVAFFPTEPATIGHTLVIPKPHIADIWALDSRTAERLASATVAIASAVRRVFDPQGLNVIQSNGEAASQSIAHLHIHVVPRWSGDAIGRFWPSETNHPEADMNDAWQRLNDECRRTLEDTAGTENALPGPEDRRKHLEFIQAVVARLADASAKTKGWLLPVITVAYGYALTKHVAAVAGLGMAAVVLFAFIDANYLDQERSFRRLYRAVAAGEPVPPFCLDPTVVSEDRARQPARYGFSRIWRSILERMPSIPVWSSWAIAPLYGALMLMGVVIWLKVI